MRPSVNPQAFHRVLMVVLILATMSITSCEDDRVATGTLSGTVYHRNTPVENASVKVGEFTANTDAMGFFAIQNINNGSHPIRITKTFTEGNYVDYSTTVVVSGDSFLETLRLPASSLLTIQESMPNSITVAWTESDSPEFKEYKLYRHNTSGLDETTGVLVHVATSPDDTVFTETGLSNETTYYYRVFTMNAFGIMGGSNIESAMTDVTNQLPEIVDNDLRLTKKYSPYVVPHEVIVNEGATLTIDPGVTIIFEEGLVINGNLVAEGTENDQIVFTASGGTQWSGIRFGQTYKHMQYSGSLKHCIIEKALICVIVSGSNNGLAFDHCLFQDAGTGIGEVIAYGSDFEFSNCTFKNLDHGVSINQGRLQEIAYNTFINNGVGLRVGMDDWQKASIHHNNFIDCATALEVSWVGTPNSYTANLTNNYWGVTDEESILSLIVRSSDLAIDVNPWLESEVTF